MILEEPKDLYKWSSNYFAQLANLPAAFGPNGEYLDGVMHDLKHKPGAGVFVCHFNKFPRHSESVANPGVHVSYFFCQMVLVLHYD